MKKIQEALEKKIPCDIELKGMYSERNEFEFTGIRVNGETFGPGYR